MTYVGPAWEFASKTGLQKGQRLQNRVLPTIAKITRRTQTQDMRVASKVLNLMLEKDREDKLDRTFEECRSIINSQEG